MVGVVTKLMTAICSILTQVFCLEPGIPKEPEYQVEAVEDSMSLDSLISELEKTEATNSVPTATPKPAMQESVFVKLANRIKVSCLRTVIFE